MDNDFVNDLPPSVGAELASRMVLTRHDRGEVVWYEGDEPDGVYFVVSGRLAVRAATADGDEATLALLGPGEVFGEMALLGTEQRRTASVIALERSRTKRVPTKDWIELRSLHREIDALVASLLASYVVRLGDRLTDTLFVPAETRVVRQLVRASQKYRSSDSVSVSVRLTGQELADLAGVSRQTVSNLLGRERDNDDESKERNPTAVRLRELGVQVEGRGLIRVKNIDLLADFADSMKQSIRS